MSGVLAPFPPFLKWKDLNAAEGGSEGLGRLLASSDSCSSISGGIRSESLSIGASASSLSVGVERFDGRSTRAPALSSAHACMHAARGGASSDCCASADGVGRPSLVVGDLVGPSGDGVPRLPPAIVSLFFFGFNAFDGLADAPADGCSASSDCFASGGWEAAAAHDTCSCCCAMDQVSLREEAVRSRAGDGGQGGEGPEGHGLLCPGMGS